MRDQKNREEAEDQKHILRAGAEDKIAQLRELGEETPVDWIGERRGEAR